MAISIKVHVVARVADTGVVRGDKGGVGFAVLASVAAVAGVAGVRAV